MDDGRWTMDDILNTETQRERRNTEVFMVYRRDAEYAEVIEDIQVMRAINPKIISVFLRSLCVSVFR